MSPVAADPAPQEAEPSAPSGLQAEVDEFESRGPLDGAARGRLCGSAKEGKSDTTVLELVPSAPW